MLQTWSKVLREDVSIYRRDNSDKCQLQGSVHDQYHRSKEHTSWIIVRIAATLTVSARSVNMVAK